MHFTKKNSSEKRIEFRKKLNNRKILRFPGAYNPLTAKLISEIGFELPKNKGILYFGNKFKSF